MLSNKPRYNNLIDYCKENALMKMLNHVSEVLAVPVEDMISKSRKRAVCDARHVYFRRSREMNMPIKMAGRMVKKSHSIVLDGRTIATEVKEVAEKYDRCFALNFSSDMKQVMKVGNI